MTKSGFDIDEIERLLAAATPGEWGIWFEQINGQADKAIQELIEQVHATQPIGNSLVMLEADGKCPAITGCGPTSADNAALIVTLHNSAPAMIAELRELRAENARLRNDKGTLLQFAQAIKTWRADANSYDRECGHTKRHYCEDVELMEKTAEYAMRRVGIRAALGEPQ